jgi:ferritin-like metal-binding protein YciE
MNTSGKTTAPTINTYLSDMLALERHIAEPLSHQQQDEAVTKSPAAKRVIDLAYTTTQSHISALEARLEQAGGHAGSGIKSGVSVATGAVAAAIGDLRKTEVSKYLRDDYSALALASASYTLLHTTALAIGDRATANLAERHLSDVADIVIRISATLPTVVLTELSEEGVAVDPSVLEEAQADVERAWHPGTVRAN